jgi:hypothetical protein
VTSTPVLRSSIASVAADTSSNNGGGGLSDGAKTGIIAGCSTVGGLILLGLLAFLFMRWNRRRSAFPLPPLARSSSNPAQRTTTHRGRTRSGGRSPKPRLTRCSRRPYARLAVSVSALVPIGGTHMPTGAGFIEREPSMRSTAAGTSYASSAAHYGQPPATTYPPSTGAPAFASYATPYATSSAYEHQPYEQPASTYEHGYPDYGSERVASPVDRQVGGNGLSSHGHGFEYDEPPHGGAHLDRGYSIASRPEGPLGVVNRDSF